MSRRGTPKAWMIIPTFTPVIGGAQTQVRYLSRFLLSEGWATEVLTRRHSYAHPDGLPARTHVDGVTVTRIFSRGGRAAGSLLYLLCGLFHLAIRGRRDVYHAHDAGAAGWLAVAAKTLFRGTAVVKLRSGVLAYQDYMRPGLRLTMFRSMLRRADWIHVVNREVAGMLAEIGINQEKILCVPNPTDTNLYAPVPSEEKAAIRDGLGFSSGELIVLYVGRLEHLKGVDILVRGWSDFTKNCRVPARLVIVGDGPEQDTLTQLVEEHGLTGSIVFAGAQDDVRSYYAAADVFVLPSRTEGLSNALREAMACALPVVASNAGGTPDIVHDSRNGLLFDSENAGALASCLARLAHDETLRQTLAREARAEMAGSGPDAFGELCDAYLNTPARKGEGRVAPRHARV